MPHPTGGVDVSSRDPTFGRIEYHERYRGSGRRYSPREQTNGVVDLALRETSSMQRPRERSHQRPVEEISVAEEEYSPKPRRSSSRRSTRSRHREYPINDHLALYTPSAKAPLMWSDSRARNSDTRTGTTSQQVIGVPCSQNCADHPFRQTKFAVGESDGDYDSEEEYHLERHKKKELRNKTILAAGLSCITTIAVGNSLYQAKKQHHLRRDAIEGGPMCTSEANRLKQEHSKRNLMTAGLVVVACYNMRNAWRRTLNQREEYHEHLESHRALKLERGQKLISEDRLR